MNSVFPLVCCLLAPALLSLTACGTGGGRDGDQASGGANGATGGSASGGLGGEPMGGEGGLPGNPSTDLVCDSPGACGLVECEAPDAGGAHVEACAELEPHTNPVTSGPHFTIWAQFGIYDEPVPEGFLLHSLEHSAVALLYNCDLVQAQGDSCEALISELEAFYDSWPADPLCDVVPHRLIVSPSPRLDVPFAATAWGAHLKGTCFDGARVTQFIETHYGQNYENICNSGIDPIGVCE